VGQAWSMTADMIHYIEWTVLSIFTCKSTYGRIIIVFFLIALTLLLFVHQFLTLLCLSRSFLNLSLLSITVHMHVSLLRLELLNDFSINCGVFPDFFWNFFVYVMYEPFLLPVWGFLVISGLISARNIRTISTTSVGLSGYFRTFLCTKHAKHFYYQCGAFRFLPDFFVYKTYKQFLLTSVGFSGFVQEIFGHTTYKPLLPIILGLTQARPNKENYATNYAKVTTGTTRAQLLLAYVVAVQCSTSGWSCLAIL